MRCITVCADIEGECSRTKGCVIHIDLKDLYEDRGLSEAMSQDNGITMRNRIR